MVKVFLSGEIGKHNVGDEGQALASASRVRAYFPACEMVTSAEDALSCALAPQARVVPWLINQYDLLQPQAAKRLARLSTKMGLRDDLLAPTGRQFDRVLNDMLRDNRRFGAIYAALQDADFVFDMGHGALNDIFGPFALCFLYWLAGHLAKPLFVSGQTIGPLWRTHSLRMMRDALPYVHTLCLRDGRVSRDALQGIVGESAGPNPRIVDVGDDTLAITAVMPDPDLFSVDTARVLREGNFFAVQWRSSDYSKAVLKTAELVPLANLVRYIVQRTGLEAVFLPFSWEIEASDTLVAMRLNHLLGGTAGRFHVIWRYLDMANLKGIVSRASFGVGLSYHFHVGFLSQGLPTIGFYTNDYYQTKLRGVFDAYGQVGDPLPYPQCATVDNERFQHALDHVLSWTCSDGQRALDRVTAYRALWHKSFRIFLLDNDLWPGGTWPELP